MKKNILILAGSLALCLGTAQAQQRDTTQTDRTKRSGQNDQAREPKTKQNQNAYNSGDVEILKNEEIPASLRQALEADEKYTGWENAIIYHNKRTGEYLVSPRAHRFDSEGNAIDYPGQKPSKRMKNKTGNDSSMNQGTDRTRQNEQSSQQRKQSESGNDQSGVDQSSGAVSGERTTPQQDTTQSSQMESTTDQGRQQSTSGRMQQDTSSENSSQGQYGNQSGQDRRTANKQSSTQESDAYRTDRNTGNANGANVNLEGMVVVQTSEIPLTLKETLNDDQYKGWEGGKLYRHESTGEYVLVMEEKMAGEGSKTYRFDKDGKLMNGSSHRDHQNKD